jgi:hypothetical protein
MHDRMDAALRSLAAEVAFPPTPDLRRRVVERIITAPSRRPWWRPAALPRAMALAIVATLLVAATVAALAFALPGLRIIFVPSVPSPSAATPVADRLALGVPVAPETVDVGVPSALGMPDEAYMLGDNEVLTLVYRASDELPPLGTSEIGLLVQRIDGVLDGGRVEKLVDEVGASITHVEVNGSDGFWIEGPPHVIRYLTPSGAARLEATRLVGDALVWERDGVLYRIESSLGRDETIEVAESIEP